VTSVFFATPCYRGDPKAVLAWQEKIARELRIEEQSRFAVVVDVATLPLARAVLVEAFQRSDCEWFFFRDDDISIESRVLQSMVDLKKDAVVAPYKVRDEDRFDVTFADGVLTHAGLGCALIHRAVIDVLCVRYFDELSFTHRGVGLVSLFDNLRVRRDDGFQMFWEDRAFWYRVRSSGFVIHALDGAVVTHAGVTTTFTSNH
jgi:GT2 family glycosyltransferase